MFCFIRLSKVGRSVFGSLTTGKTDLKLYPVGPCSRTNIQKQANKKNQKPPTAGVHIIIINSYPKSLLSELEGKIKCGVFLYCAKFFV